MKKKIFLITSLCTTMILSSCDKFLEQQPLSAGIVENYYKNEFEANAALSGMYSSFNQLLNGDQFQERYNFWGDYRSDNFERFISYTNNTINEVHLNTLTPDNPYSDWSGLYQVINSANMNIKYLPQVAAKDINYTTAELNEGLADSYAMRAVCYFYIVRVWGDAPIRITPYEDRNEDASLPREPASKVIDEVIIKDLEKAYSLRAKNQTANAYALNEAAICAVLADVYMWKKDYPNAISWINKLFAAKSPAGSVYSGTSGANLEATASWKNVFVSPATSKEAIWSLHWDYAANGCACLAISYSPNNRPVRVDPDQWASFFLPARTATPTDIRPKQTLDLYATSSATNNNRDRFIKWYNTPANPTTSSVANTAIYRQETPVYLVMYRLADIYLLLAEAHNGNNNLAEALRYLNYVRVRAGLPAYLSTNTAVSTKPAMENAILRERQLELYGEGKRWFDLVRTNKVQEVMTPVLNRRQTEAGSTPTGFADLRRVYWPISRSVLNSNRELVQNPGYTD